jgi:two-component system CheB/CheR fusion protein
MRRATSQEEFIASFLGRIEALARSHGLLARDNWGDLELEEILKAEFTPYASEQEQRIRLAGPRVQVRPKAALALGLVVHELATNAVKHGALSGSDGRVGVAWTIEAVDGQRQVVLRWTETDGPAAPPEGKGGFGTELVEREVRYELGGTVSTDYTSEGLRIVISIPIDPLLVAKEPADGRAPPAES